MNVAEMIKQRLGNDVDVKPVSINKNNGVIHNGYCIRKEGSMITPTIYYDNGMSEDEIVEHIVKLYKKRGDMSDFETAIHDIFKSAENVYSKVFPVLINRNKNNVILQNVVHRPFLDMEIIYKVKIFDNGNFGIGTVTIKNEHAEHFGLGLDKLHESAMKNLVGLGRITGMFEMLASMNVPFKGFGEYPQDEKMYVVSNDAKINGASVIMLDDVMQELHERLHSDEIVILPSSIHEVICVSTEGMPLCELKDMVGQVNISEVSEEEVLSDSIYIHNISGEWKVVA